MSEFEECIIPTGCIRTVCMLSHTNQNVHKTQMRFSNYDNTKHIWRDVPIVYCYYNEFSKKESVE